MKKGKSRRFREINKVIEAYLPKLAKSQKGMGPLRSSEVAENIAFSGVCSVNMSDNPAEHIKTWNRKQEITDIIKEAMLCTTK